MLNPLTTSFVHRLRAKDQAAWFELWETFGPVLRSQLTKWGKGRVGPETVQDLSQETLAALSDCIDRYDSGKGARFSTWLLAIARHVLGDEIDRRSAIKRGGSGAGNADKPGSGRIGRTQELDDSWMAAGGGPSPDAEYEAAMFAAKVRAALRMAEKASDFAEFEVYRMRVLEGKSGKEVAEALGASEPTVSRRLARVRQVVRGRLQEVILTYSFTEDEQQEAQRNGLTLDPKNTDDALFDEAVGELWRRSSAGRSDLRDAGSSTR
jgi:RNA polymerase sigma factor (sigma-70 family)